MTIDFTVIGKRISEIRKDRGLYQDQLAAMINISRSHLSHIESGSRAPTIEILINIAESMDVTVDELLLDLHYSPKINEEIYELLTDCNEKEKYIFKQTISFLKSILREDNL